MQVGITGGTGFVGSHLARRLADDGHEVVCVSRSGGDGRSGHPDSSDVEFVAASVGDRRSLEDALAGCDAVAHLAGINVERGDQTYEAVHVRGTRNVVAAAEDAGASTVALSSFLRARPDCGSAYHESKWAAEEIVRRSSLDHTVFKPGVVYGRGDHMLEHLSRALRTVAVFGSIGFDERRVRPLAVADLVECLIASLVDDRLSESTVAVVGPEELSLEAVVRRVGDVIGRDPLIFPVPVPAHYGLAWLQETAMRTPVTTRAQVRILAEDVVAPAPPGSCDPLPDDLAPERALTRERIEGGLGDVRPYGLADLRW